MSEQRLAYLKAMGIDVWTSRHSDSTVVASAASKTATYSSAETPVITEEKISPQPVENLTEISFDAVNATWDELAKQVQSCQLCDLSGARKQTVFGAGHQQASLMIIGEAPGEEENLQGQPFVGPSGQLLTAMLKAMGLQRSDVFITNILKCHPPHNREPLAEEVSQCLPYLKRQIELVQPEIILALGSVAAQRLLKTKSTLARLRGQTHFIDDMNVPVIVTYHPAYLLRSPKEKRKAWEDLQIVMKSLR